MKTNFIFRIFWIFSLCVSSLTFILLISKTTEKFLTNQIVIKLSKQQYSVGNIPFPAVSICPDVALPSNISEIIENFSENSDRQKWVHVCIHESTFNYLIFSLNVMHAIDLIYSQNILHSKNVSISAEYFEDTLKNMTQYEWFGRSLTSSWRSRYSVSYSNITTKWGICFTSNLLPAEKLLNFNKSVGDSKFQ